MKAISIRLPDWMLELIEKLCEAGVFISRSEFIRYAIRLGLKKYQNELKDKPNTPRRIQAYNPYCY